MRITRMAPGTVLAVFMLGGCSGNEEFTAPSTPSLSVEDAGHNTADHFKGVETAAFDVESPCNGELIAFSGENAFQVTLVGTRGALDAGNVVHAETQSHTRATGTGAESGASYTINDIYHDSFNSPSPPATQYTFTVHSHTRITSSVPSLSFTLNFALHFVQLPSGEFKVTRAVDNARCAA